MAPRQLDCDARLSFSVAARSSMGDDLGGTPQVCFGEQTENKGLPGGKYKRVRKTLKTRVLYGRPKIEKEGRAARDEAFKFHVSV